MIGNGVKTCHGSATTSRGLLLHHTTYIHPHLLTHLPCSESSGRSRRELGLRCFIGSQMTLTHPLAHPILLHPASGSESRSCRP